MSDSEEDIFLTHSSFNGSINSGNDLENLLEDYQNAQFSIEEATEGLFSFNQADKYEEVSIGSVDKEPAETNEKKTSKRDIIVVDDKELRFVFQWTPGFTNVQLYMFTAQHCYDIMHNKLVTLKLKLFTSHFSTNS